MSVNLEFKKRAHLFLEAYGKHMLAMELLILISSFLSITLLTLFSLKNYLLGVLLWFFVVYVHTLVCIFVSRAELCPRQSLLLEFFRRYLYKLLFLLTVPAIILLFYVSIYLPEQFWYQNPLFNGLVTYTTISVGLLVILVFYGIGLNIDRVRFRLSLRSALVGLKLISMEKDNDRRKILIRKYLRWTKNGFLSYNHYLYRTSPEHIEVADIQEYYQSLFCVALFGHEEDIALISEQIRLLLNYVPSRKSKKPYDIGQVLTRLRNIGNLERTQEYGLSELKQMTKMTSRSDRAKKLLSSPVVIALIGIVPIILQIISMLKLV